MEPFKDLSDVDLFELKERTERVSIDFFSGNLFDFVWLFSVCVCVVRLHDFVFIFIFHCSKYIGKLSLRAIAI